MKPNNLSIAYDSLAKYLKDWFLTVIIHILEKYATSETITDMLQAHRFYIKTVVDIRRQILAGGGELQDATIRDRVKQVIHKLLGDV